MLMNRSLNSIVFITGTFISNTCWDEWIQQFENEGYKCIAPSWPFKNAPAEELRNRPERDSIASNTITSVTDYFASIISELTEKPILIGHSLGGLVVQLLLQRELAAAGVAIHSFPPHGVGKFTLSFLRAMWETIMLFTSAQETYMMSFSKWKYSIANGMTYEHQKIRLIMKKKSKKSNDENKFPGYPPYPASDDITKREGKLEGSIEDLIDHNKQQIQQSPNELNTEFDEGMKNRTTRADFSGDDLDIPGAELDDEQEQIGNEDEENNLYSLGGDNHEDLEENRD